MLPLPPVTGLPAWAARPRRCLVMGVLNVTPDSFSDGGRYLQTGAALAQARRLVAAGADIVDVGGESTRPGARQVATEEQVRRITPVVRSLAADGVLVSVDTMDAEVARAALDAGATIINDVSGGLADARMFPLVAERCVPYVLMHWRGHSTGMNALALYEDVPGEVHDEVATRLDAFVRAGGDVTQVILDPGLGFAKDAHHNLELLRHLDVLGDLGRPVLVGASRKRFVGSILQQEGRPAEPADRDAATAAITALVAAQGAWGVRVHDVAPNVDAVRMVAAIHQGGAS